MVGKKALPVGISASIAAAKNALTVSGLLWGRGGASTATFAVIGGRWGLYGKQAPEQIAATVERSVA